MKIVIINDTDTQHLEIVKRQMLDLGAPTIRAVWDECNQCWVALEGSHRIIAAHQLGLVPEIEEVEYSSLMLSEVLGEVDEDYSVEDIFDTAWERINRELVVDFEEAE